MTDSLVLSQLLIPLETILRVNRTSYDWHRWIWRAFPGSPDKERDFLFRVDVRNRQARVLLLSKERPASVAGWAWETKTVDTTFLNQGNYRFQVRVNPTFRRASDHRRIAIIKEGDLREWISRKLTAIGAQLLSVEIDNPREELFAKEGKRGKHITVDMRGVLSVTEKELFREGLCKGIGSAKGFGNGLLMLQPIQL